MQLPALLREAQQQLYSSVLAYLNKSKPHVGCLELHAMGGMQGALTATSTAPALWRPPHKHVSSGPIPLYMFRKVA